MNNYYLLNMKIYLFNVHNLRQSNNFVLKFKMEKISDELH